MTIEETALKHKNRWVPVFAGVILQLCLGTSYIWSVFQSYLIISSTTPNALFLWPATYGTLAYALLLGHLTVGSILGGLIQRTRTPAFTLRIAGLIMGAGFLLVQFTTQSAPWILWLSYGVLGGIGMGMVYTTIIATCQKWFPDKRGLITGIVVSALGFGALLFTPLAELMISNFGVLQTFTLLGILFIVVSMLCSFFIENPTEGYQPKGWIPPKQKEGIILQSFAPSEALKTRQFYMVTFVFMCATASGSMMIPMAKILGLQPDSNLTKEAAIAGVMIVAAFNSFGRLFWGWASDRLGRKKTIQILLVIAAFSISIVSFVDGYLMLCLIAVIGFSYGGFHGVFPALTADFWGTKYGATIYGMIMMGFGVGAVASSFTVAYLSATASFSAAFAIAGIASAVGFVVISFLKPPKQKIER